MYLSALVGNVFHEQEMVTIVNAEFFKNIKQETKCISVFTLIVLTYLYINNEKIRTVAIHTVGT